MSKLQVSATTPIRTWYIKTYPTDDVGPTLDPAIAFADLWQALKREVCVYAALGGDADSIVRERVFEKLAALLGTDYDRIYTLWSLAGREDELRKKNRRILDQEECGLLTPAEAARMITDTFAELSDIRSTNWRLRNLT